MSNPGDFIMAAAPRRGAYTRYGPDNQVVAARLAELDALLAKLRMRGTHVILVVPPVAPPVAEAMAASPRHRYLEDLDRMLRHRGDEYYNFHDARALSADVCEYADATHAGNVVYMKMLRAMADRNPAGPLARALERPRLDAAIARFAGRTIVSFEADGALPAERDFLEAGCRRTAESGFKSPAAQR
jgi:hypothetical protein